MSAYLTSHQKLNPGEISFLKALTPESKLQSATFEGSKFKLEKRWTLPDNYDNQGSQFTEDHLKTFVLENRANLAHLEKMFSILKKLNPELESLKPIDLDNKGAKARGHFDILYGIASRYNIDDIKFYVEDEAKYSSHALKKRAILALLDHDPDYMVAPQNLDRLLQAAPAPRTDYQRDALEKIDRIFHVYGESIVKFQAILSANGFRADAIWLDPHLDYMRRKVEDLKTGDILVVEGGIYSVEKRGRDISLVANGESRATSEQELLGKLNEITIYKPRKDSIALEHYSAHPDSLLPEHYVKEYKVNLFNSLFSNFGLEASECAKVCERVGNTFSELLTQVDPETKRASLAMNHVVQTEEDGNIFAVAFFNKDQTQSRISSIVGIPFKLPASDNAQKLIDIIEAALLAPPETDSEILDLLDRAAKIELRPEYSEIISALFANPNVSPYKQRGDEGASKTAFVELTRFTLALNGLPKVPEGFDLKLTQDHASRFISLFDGGEFNKARQWAVKTVADDSPWAETATKFIEGYPTSKEIDRYEVIGALNCLVSSNGFVSGSNSPVESKRFWDIAADKWFARCEKIDLYIMLSMLNDQGRSNLSNLLKAGLILIPEKPFEEAGFMKCIEIFNRSDLKDLKQKAVDQILGDEDCIFLSLPCKDTRNEDSKYFKFGSKHWEENATLS